jgi:hypothetical protein
LSPLQEQSRNATLQEQSRNAPLQEQSSNALWEEIAICSENHAKKNLRGKSRGT